MWLLFASLNQLHGETIKAEGCGEDSHCHPQDPARRCPAGFTPGAFIEEQEEITQ